MNDNIYEGKYLFKWKLITGTNISIFAKTWGESIKRLEIFCRNSKAVGTCINPINGITVFYDGYYDKGFDSHTCFNESNSNHLLAG